MNKKIPRPPKLTHKNLTVRMEQKTINHIDHFSKHYGISASKYLKFAIYKFFLTKNRYKTTQLFHKNFADEIALDKKKQERYLNFNTEKNL
jgi:hypothetical protein